MLPHEEFLTIFRGALNGVAPAMDMLTCPPSEAGRRFAVYRNNVMHSLCEALSARFPVICRLLGKEFFSSLARLYLQSSGPRSPILIEWGGDFAGFLSGFAPLAAYPYMADVARIEYARGRAFHAADAAPADPGWFSGLDPWSARLGLHPSVHVIRLQHAAVSIWTRNQPGGETTDIPRGSEIGLILRNRHFEVPVRAVSPGDAALIEALQRGDSVGEAAGNAATVQHDHDPSSILIHLMRQGAIIRPETS